MKPRMGMLLEGQQFGGYDSSQSQKSICQDKPQFSRNFGQNYRRDVLTKYW
jgi:hypothetical protein